MGFQDGLLGDGPVFDWYQASVSEDPFEVVEVLAKSSATKPCMARKMNRYDRTIGLAYPGLADPVCTVSFGGNDGAPPHIKTTGYYSRYFATEIKARWPLHRVSRCDSAYDFVGAGLYDEFVQILDSVHRERQVKRCQRGFVENGRTYYLGSHKAPVLLRCYEKDKELASRGLVGTPGHVRLELQVRPRTNEKGKYAPLDALQVWGASQWSRAVLDRVLDKQPEPIKQVPPVNKTAQQKFVDLLTQYSRTLQDVGQEDAQRLLAVFYAEGTEGLSRAVTDGL